MSVVIAAAGWSPAGDFAPATFGPPAMPPALLADDVDPATGELASLTRFVHPIDAAIAEQFRLVRDSGIAVIGQGQRFDAIEHVTDSTPRELEDEARLILQPFVERGDVSIERVDTQSPVDGTDGDTGLLTLHYRNLLTGKSVPVPL